MPRPTRELLGLYLRLGLALDVLFVAVYGGINLLTARRQDLVRLYFDWEPDIPLVAPMILVYASILILFLLPPWWLGAAQLRRLAARMALAILLAGAVFLLWPGEVGYPAGAPVTGFEWAFRILHALDLPYNLFPSLHIALSGLIVSTLAAHLPRWGRWLLGGWFVAICLSVVLVHQHHLADVAGGVVLVWLCRRAVGDASAGPLTPAPLPGGKGSEQPPGRHRLARVHMAAGAHARVQPDECAAIDTHRGHGQGQGAVGPAAQQMAADAASAPQYRPGSDTQQVAVGDHDAG